MDEIFDIKEAAAYLKVPLGQIYGLVRAGQLKAFRVGKHWRIPKIGLQAWIDKQITRENII